MHYLTRRPDEILADVTVPIDSRMAQRVLEAAAPRVVRLSRRVCRRGRRSRA